MARKKSTAPNGADPVSVKRSIFASTESHSTRLRRGLSGIVVESAESELLSFVPEPKDPSEREDAQSR